MANKTCVVQILSPAVDHVVGKSADGRGYDFYTQTAFITSSDPFPQKITVTLPQGAPPYVPGVYLLGGGCVVQKAVNSAAGKARIAYGFEPAVELVSLADALAELQAMDKAARAAAPVAAPVRAVG